MAIFELIISCSHEKFLNLELLKMILWQKAIQSFLNVLLSLHNYHNCIYEYMTHTVLKSLFLNLEDVLLEVFMK